jgi:hypothetical protein
MTFLGLKINVRKTDNVQGLWIETPTNSVFTVYFDKLQGLVAGFYKDQKEASGGCDLALSITDEGVNLQVKQDDGQVKIRKIL